MTISKAVSVICASVLALLFFTASTSVYADDAGYVEWNGVSVLEGNTKYRISEDVTISSRLVIPKDSRLVVRNKATLTIGNEAVLSVRGRLYVSGGAKLKNKGTIRLYSSGLLDVSGSVVQNGTLKANSGSAINLSGSIKTGKSSSSFFACVLTLSKKAELKLYGKVSVTGTFVVGSNSSVYAYSKEVAFGEASETTVKGRLTFMDGSAQSFDGKITVSDGGRLYICGKGALGGSFSVLSGGRLYIRGDIKLKSTAAITVYGRLYLNEGGTLTQYGILTVKSGGTVSGGGILRSGKLNNIVNDGKITVGLSCIRTEKSGVTYCGGLVLVNKQFTLPSDYSPGTDGEAYSAYLEMYAAAKDAGFSSMSIKSGYRSYGYQRDVFAYWCGVYGEATANTLSARPGQSEHQTGLALDISSTLTAYGDTAEGKWLAAHCAEYGFVVRYPWDKTDITGYIYEPWHIRYVGVNAAKLITDSGLCLEEFFGVQ